MLSLCSPTLPQPKKGAKMLLSHCCKTLTLAAVLLGSAGIAVPPATAQGLWSLSCGDLWYKRNAIYARNGYCFKTNRARRVFGNAGCAFYAEGDVPMSHRERQLVATIRDIEREKGCRF
jgi:YARHG domain